MNNFMLGNQEHFLNYNGMLCFKNFSREKATRWTMQPVSVNDDELIVKISIEKDNNIEVEGQNCFVKNETEEMR